MFVLRWCTCEQAKGLSVLDAEYEAGHTQPAEERRRVSWINAVLSQAANNAFERALVFLHKMPRIWFWPRNLCELMVRFHDARRHE